MRGCQRWRAVVCASFAALLGGALAARAGDEATAGAASRVRLRGHVGAAVRQAVEGARARLLEPDCRRLLDEFADASGLPLQHRLDQLGLTAAEYVGFVIFVNGESDRLCRTGEVFGGTRPGSRVVTLCGMAFARTQWNNPRYAEALIIHETLHTLGLGEDPPSSLEITRRVLRSCSAERRPAMRP